MQTQLGSCIATVKENTRLIFSYVINKDLVSLKKALSNKLPYEVNNMRDEYNNNLLHIGIAAENPHIIKYLIEKGINKHQENIHKLSSWHLAIRSHNQTIIQFFIDNHLNIIDELKKDLDLVKKTEIEYKLLNNKLQQSNNDLIFKKNAISLSEELLKNENVLLRGQNKRLREENVVVLNENNKLMEDNKKLKTSVSSLIQTKKK